MELIASDSPHQLLILKPPIQAGPFNVSSAENALYHMATNTLDTGWLEGVGVPITCHYTSQLGYFEGNLQKCTFLYVSMFGLICLVLGHF